MKQIILDYSANTHKNDLDKIRDIINEVSLYDKRRHEIIFKSQLFKKAGDNIVCKTDSFNFMYNKCKELGYKCTASVFDEESLLFLLKYDIPFIKIANNKKYYYLMDYVPRSIPVYISHDSNKVDGFYDDRLNKKDKVLRCVSKYPAKFNDYRGLPGCSISDHTVGLELYNIYQPKIWEKHIIQEGDDGLDAGPFAITPEELSKIL